MSLVIPPGFASAAFIFSTSAGTGPLVTTCGYDITEVTGDFVDVANDLKAAYAAELGSITQSILTLDRVTLAVGSSGPGGSVDSDSAPVPMTGSSTNASAVAISAIARKSTNRLGRSGRGRMFLPAVLNESAVDPDGSIVPATRTAINNALTGFYVGCLAVDCQPVLLHSDTLSDTTPDVVTAFTVSDIIGLIRGRIR